MAVDQQAAKRALDRWARLTGYSDFDVYMLAGGTIKDAMLDLQKRRTSIDLAVAAIYAWTPPPPQPAAHPDDPDLEDYERALSRLEAEHAGEDAAPDAPTQGAEA